MTTGLVLAGIGAAFFIAFVFELLRPRLRPAVARHRYSREPWPELERRGSPLEPLPPARPAPALGFSREPPPASVRRQDQLGQTSMSLAVSPLPLEPRRVLPLDFPAPLPRLGTPIRALLKPAPREWRVGRAPNPFVINPPDIRTLVFRLLLPVEELSIPERVRRHYATLEVPSASYLASVGWPA